MKSMMAAVTASEFTDNVDDTCYNSISSGCTNSDSEVLKMSREQ